MSTLIRILVLFLLQTYPIAYYETTIKPDASMRDLGAVNVKVYFAENGVFVPRCLPAQITKYIIWVNPSRPPMYRVEDAPYGWFMVEHDRLPQVEC